MQQERKRSRALPPEGWIGESKSVKKRQVINVFSSYLRFIFLIILALTIFMKIKEYQYNFFFSYFLQFTRKSTAMKKMQLFII